jgi:hypothetical protein
MLIAIAASAPLRYWLMTQKMMTVMAIAVATKKKDGLKIADDGSYLRLQDPEYMPVYRALIAGDPSCLLHTDSANRTRCFCCAARLKS